MSALIDRVSSIDRGAEVISDWLGEGGIPVDQQLAQSRADICLKCQHNRQGPALIEAVAYAIRKHIEVKNHLNMRVDGEKSLHECGVCLCALRLKVWVPISLIKRQMLDREEQKFIEANPQCWQANEKT